MTIHRSLATLIFGLGISSAGNAGLVHSRWLECEQSFSKALPGPVYGRLAIYNPLDDTIQIFAKVALKPVEWYPMGDAIPCRKTGPLLADCSSRNPTEVETLQATIAFGKTIRVDATLKGPKGSPLMSGAACRASKDRPASLRGSED